MKIIILTAENVEEISKLTGRTLSELCAMNDSAEFRHEVVMFILDEIPIRVPVHLTKTIKDSIVDNDVVKEVLHRQAVTDTRDAIMRVLMPQPNLSNDLTRQLAYYNQIMVEEDDLRWRAPSQLPVWMTWAQKDREKFEQLRRDATKPFPETKFKSSLFEESPIPEAEVFRTVMSKDVRRQVEEADLRLAKAIVAGEITVFAEDVTREQAYSTAVQYLKEHEEGRQDVD